MIHSKGFDDRARGVAIVPIGAATVREREGLGGHALRSLTRGVAIVPIGAATVREREGLGGHALRSLTLAAR
jgi:hypothetical protein